MFDFDLMSIIAGLPGLLIALVCHEYAHARMAVEMGDFTPRAAGRLTLSPKAHIDWFGLLMLLFCRFGWARPVEYNPFNFRDRVKGEILVALAGPSANFAIAFLSLLALSLFGKFAPNVVTGGFAQVFILIVIFNINFGIFNLIPLPPLDGSKVLFHILPHKLRWQYMQIERYSFFILIALMMTPILSMILIPSSRFILRFFYAIIYAIL